MVDVTAYAKGFQSGRWLFCEQLDFAVWGREGGSWPDFCSVGSEDVRAYQAGRVVYRAEQMLQQHERGLIIQQRDLDESLERLERVEARRAERSGLAVAILDAEQERDGLLSMTNLNEGQRTRLEYLQAKLVTLRIDADAVTDPGDTRYEKVRDETEALRAAVDAVQESLVEAKQTFNAAKAQYLDLRSRTLLADEEGGQDDSL